MSKKHIASLAFLFASLVFFLFLLTEKVPKYASIFASFNAELPIITVITLHMSGLARMYFVFILPVIFLAFFSYSIFLVLAAKKRETFFVINIVLTVLFLFMSFVVFLGIELPLKEIEQVQSQKKISVIEISFDKKSILNAETKGIVFTIEDAKEYLKDSGYAYNPDTFQTTNAKYAGDCFEEAALSNNKEKIVFSTSCVSGDLPQAWIGNFYIIGSYYKGIRIGKNPLSDKINFLIGGNGKNFAWSVDDKTITYEADLGMSGMTEIRTIDSVTGKILERKNTPAKNDLETADWKTYRNEEYGFEMKYPEDFFTEQVLQPKTKVIQCDYANFINNCPTGMITINGAPFCLQKTDGAAAGTTYATYNYTTVRNKECFAVSFTVPYPNCSNLLPIENQEIQEAYDKCKLDNEVTKPKTINQILSTFKFTEKEVESFILEDHANRSIEIEGVIKEIKNEKLGRNVYVLCDLKNFSSYHYIYNGSTQRFEKAFKENCINLVKPGLSSRDVDEIKTIVESKLPNPISKTVKVSGNIFVYDVPCDQQTQVSCMRFIGINPENIVPMKEEFKK